MFSVVCERFRGHASMLVLLALSGGRDTSLAILWVIGCYGRTANIFNTYVTHF